MTMIANMICAAIIVVALVHFLRNARKFAANWQRKRNADAYKRYVKGVRDLEASMAADGTWKA